MTKEFTIVGHRAEVARERRKLDRLFPGGENLDAFSRRILIQRYQELWRREQYPFGAPRNLIKLS